ncbi:hypothetical protein LguiA_014796 [Lonicera macranthoides]
MCLMCKTVGTDSFFHSPFFSLSTIPHMPLSLSTAKPPSRISYRPTAAPEQSVTIFLSTPSTPYFIYTIYFFFSIFLSLQYTSLSLQNICIYVYLTCLFLSTATPPSRHLPPTGRRT